MAWALPCIMFFCTLIFCTLIFLQSSASSAGNSSSITVGKSLSATINNGSSWLSPSGDFAFGFHPFANNTDLYLLAIWYAKIPDSIVWYANEGNPAPQGSTVTITANEGLVLSDPQGNHLWNTTDDLSGAGVSSGLMNDTGNFILISSSSSDAVWQTFEHPTDTLLPTQIMEAGGDVISRRSETNFTRGRFELRLLPDGNLVLNTRDLATGFAYGAYYVSGTNDPNPANVGYRVIYDESGYMYILRKNGSSFNVTQPGTIVSSKDNYQRITLDFDGVLTWYSHPRTFTSHEYWSSITLLPDNICMRIASYGGDFDSGACGYNSICSIGEDKRPRCQCPPSYSLVDPNDPDGSCVPDFKPDVCEAHGLGSVDGEYKLVQLENTDWPFADYARLDPSSAEECKSSCLDDCFCAAAIFSDTTCWKKKLPLSNGRHDSEVTRTAWLKIGNANNSEVPPTAFLTPPKPKSNLKTAVSALLCGSLFIILVVLSAIGLGICFIYKKKQSRGHSEGHNNTLCEYTNVRCFSYQELEDATNGFQEQLGKGAFGVVYRGRIRAGDHPMFVAVKKLDRLSENIDKEFKTEVNVIGQTHHKNLVRLLGFCKEDDQRLLVYEYMSNGNLADYLFGDLRPSWMMRIQIAQGIARGLLYLHEECSTQIIHCDIKPQNILLDDYHNARISDFGLAKLLVLDQTHTNTAIRGTKGYVAPEWFRNKPVTVKVDVYSFGVLLLEIACCRRSVSMEISGEEKAILTDWAFDCYQSNTLDALVNNDMEALNDRLRLERFLMVALWCIQEDPSLRPTMKMATQMLEGVLEVPNPPCPVSFPITTQS